MGRNPCEDSVIQVTLVSMSWSPSILRQRGRFWHRPRLIGDFGDFVMKQSLSLCGELLVAPVGEGFWLGVAAVPQNARQKPVPVERPSMAAEKGRSVMSKASSRGLDWQAGSFVSRDFRPGRGRYGVDEGIRLTTWRGKGGCWVSASGRTWHHVLPVSITVIVSKR